MASHILSRLETLIRTQFLEEKDVLGALKAQGAPAVSVAVLEADEIKAKVLGSANGKPISIDGSTPIYDNETVFQACSISKAITALAVMKLCQDGRLDDQAPISRYLTSEQLSWISTPTTLPLASKISIRHLLSHTSGLSTHGFAGYPKPELLTPSQIIQGSPPTNSEPIKMVLLPGQKMRYSGGGFTVLQLLLETHLQKPFHQIMDETVLKPLHMTRSSFQPLSRDERNYAPAYLNGTIRADPDHHLLPESAAAGLWTTPSDLLKAVQAVQHSLESDGFLERGRATLMITEVEQNKVGLGWFTKKGENTFQHQGSNHPGYRCIAGGYDHINGPDGVYVPKNCGISVMTSSALGDVVCWKIIAAVAYLNGWPALISNPYIPFVDRSAKIDARAAGWCGGWEPGLWNLEQNGGGFAVRRNGWPAVPLVAAAIPPHEYDQGKSIDLVADGLETMFRLGWKDGKKIMEVWQDGEKSTLDFEEKVHGAEGQL